MRMLLLFFTKILFLRCTYLKQYRIVVLQKLTKISDRFNEEFGLAEPVEDTSLRSKNEDWCWFFDPYYKAKARVSLFVVAGS